MLRLDGLIPVYCVKIVSRKFSRAYWMIWEIGKRTI